MYLSNIKFDFSINVDNLFISTNIKKTKGLFNKVMSPAC